MTQPAEQTTLARLLQRLVVAAEASLQAGDLEMARATAEEVLAVDPGHEGATRICQRVADRLAEPVGERALMTLIFSDLVGSTQLSQQVEPEQLRDLFSFYRGAARRAVERYSGYVMKYMGDGILAGFGYPDAHEDDARRAVLAGLDIVAALVGAREELIDSLGAAPQVRVGIHTGRVVVADLSDQRSSDERDSIVGVAPNLAARIQGAAAADQVVISDITKHLVEADFYLTPLGVRELKGIRRPVEVFAVDRPRHAGARFQAEPYRRADLVDRDEPLRRLEAAWDRVSGQDPQSESAYLIVGEPGIGKTRLVAELVGHVDARGGRVLGAGCLPFYANVALWPLTQMLERLVRVAGAGAGVGAAGDRLDLLVAHLESLGLDPRASVPFLGPLLGIAPTGDYPAPELDPAAVLAQTQARTVEWLAALGARTPTLLVVEDLHWADPSTLGLLAMIVERRPPGVLAVATSRPELEIGWRDAVDTITLQRLAPAAAGRLVASLAGGQELSGEVRDSIVARSEGIPLFVEELTQSCLEEGGGEGMPLKLRELLTWRLKSPAVNLRVVQAAATLGPAFDADVLSSVVGDADLVQEQLGVLTEEGIIEPLDSAANTHRFRHALMRDAAYDTQVLDVRGATHGRVARALSERGAEQALVAEHLDRAGDTAGAIATYIGAAEAQQAKGAHPEAADLLSRALGLLTDVGESEQRDLDELTARMLRAASVSAMQGFAAPDVRADHERAEDLARRLGERGEVPPSLIAIWAYFFASGELETSGGLIERLQTMVAQESFSWFLPEVESSAGFQNLFTGNLADAQAHFDRALAGFLARPESAAVSAFWPLPNDPIAVSEIGLACICALRGDDPGARRWEAEALARTDSIGFPRGPFSAAFVKTYAAWMRRIAGDEDGSRALGQQVVGIGQQYGYAYWVMLGSSYLAGRGSDSPDSEFHAQTMAALRAMGQRAFTASGLAHLADLKAAEGAPAAALALVDEALDSVYESGELLHLAPLLRQRAKYSLARGDDPAEVVEDLRESVAVAEAQGARVERLRSALALARLPQRVRPSDWRDLLAAARADLPPTSEAEEAAAADGLLL